MNHKKIQYKGYFILALVFISAGAVLGTTDATPAVPFFAVGLVFWAVGSAKTAKRNAWLKTDANHP